MFLPNTMRSSAPVMPISAIEANRFFDIGRELVGNGGYTEKLGHERILYQGAGWAAAVTLAIGL
jgi:hypothetical protein